jgi:hypothetical protein
MSRYVVPQKNGSLVAYGFDHVTGYFFQKFAAEPDEDGEEVLEIDECSMFTKMDKTRMLTLMKKYDLPEVHSLAVSLDIPF